MAFYKKEVLYIKKIFFKCLLIFEGETEHEQGREQDRKQGRGRETQNVKQAPGSELSAQSRRGARTHES